MDDLSSDESKHSVNLVEDLPAFKRRRRAVVGDAGLTGDLAVQLAITPHDDGDASERAGDYVPPTIPDAGPMGEPSADNLLVPDGGIAAGVDDSDESNRDVTML